MLPVIALTGDRDEDRYIAEERAGILQYEAGMSREEAEAVAVNLARGQAKATGRVNG